MTPDELGFTVQQAADKLHLSPYTLREKIHQGQIGARKYAGRYWITQQDIDTYLEEALQVFTPTGKDKL